ncbi:SHOCT-like domain-containing protein [Spirochaeta isovalerica]|uniref:DUF4097 and DUF4098 domain-containing protein YvlB n=1 Tax=Spirochaeta isovalerica TaxID=150 RepID=A0A841RCH6_9SPIO|nr:DUF4097 family beta strand repeat-containing protein [Spirochaeta isovalerica]MBB6480102.1 DUF4097 and DUF4098 domain-containing protein YvlB [Spirochaeta isovalerica]
MKEERLEILKMLQEGIISAEEAEKLLSALDKGEKDSRHRHNSEETFSFGNFFSNFDKGFSDLGKAVGDLFENISISGKYRDFTPVAMEDNRFTPGEGVRIEISQPGRGFFNGNSDISVIASPDKAIHIIEGDCEVLRKNGVIALLCSEDCKITIPENMGEVAVQLFNGSIEIDRIDAPVRVETVNGDIVLKNCSRPAKLKTVSGRIESRISGKYKGKMELNTVSGKIGLFIPRSFSGLCESTTISGNVSCHVRENMAEERGSEDFRKSVHFRFGEGDRTNKVLCRTVSGNVELESDEYTG